MRQSGSREEAEDALYEGMAGFIVNVKSGKFNQESTINTYLTSICKRIWFKKFKRMMVHKNWVKTELNKSQGFHEIYIITKELKNGLEILMTNLKDKCKEILQLWSLGYNMSEISHNWVIVILKWQEIRKTYV